MFYYYVYLILSQNRIVILKKQVNDQDYHLLLTNHGNNEVVQLNVCKAFCVGYILGTQTRRSIVNNIEEFY